MQMIGATAPLIVKVVTPESGLTQGVAFAGLVLAAVSIVWQAVTFQLSGARVRVEMRVGAFNAGGVVQWTKPGFPEPHWFPFLSNQGFSEPVLIATIRNVGRMPVTVESCNWHAQEVALSQDLSPPGQALPHRLESHDKCFVVVRLRAVAALIDSANEVRGTTSREIWPEVRLGSGRDKIGNRLTIPQGLLGELL